MIIQNTTYAKRFFIMLLLIGSSLAGKSQEVMPLWPDGAPGNNECPQPEEIYEGRRVRFVSEATLTLYLPDKENNSGAAIVICPGGGYWIEAMDHEGYDYAEYLQKHGIAGIVLKYRLPYGHHDIPLLDAQQAIRTVRQNASKWGIDPQKIGISGFSAGGHLASTASTHFTLPAENGKVSSRPDFSVLVYPVITMNEAWGHMGSRENLLGKTHDIQLINKYSNELQVSADTPPTLLILADDDTAVPPRNSIEYYSALKRYNVPAEMHIFSKGGHGFGMYQKGLPHDKWPEILIDWLKTMQIVNP